MGVCEGFVDESDVKERGKLNSNSSRALVSRDALWSMCDGRQDRGARHPAWSPWPFWLGVGWLQGEEKVRHFAASSGFLYG